MTPEAKIQEAILICADVMIKNNLDKWTVKVHSRRKALADCSSKLKTIRFSKHFLCIANREQLEGVTLHEIAHALVGPGHGHDTVFKQKCTELGVDSKYANAKAEGISLPYKYSLTCTECFTTTKSNVKKRYSCSNCFKDGKISYFLFTENETEVVPL